VSKLYDLDFIVKKSYRPSMSIRKLPLKETGRTGRGEEEEKREILFAK